VKNLPYALPIPRRETLFLRVILNRLLLFALTFVCLTAAAQDEEGRPSKRKGSRVLDDTTRQVYGPNTSKYYYEHDVFYNRNVISPIDTLIRNFHRFNYVQGNDNLYQDLGNIGTAIRPIYYMPPNVIGVRSGFDAYDLYWDSEVIEYYDTKSPYSNMNVILGGRGRSMTRANFSRNINSRWNFGINYRGFFIDKQVPERTGKGDRVTRSNYYDAYTAYHTKDSIYRVFINFQRVFHRVEEPGGVRLNEGDSALQYYFEPTAKVWLNDAESNDLRMNFHLHHTLKIGTALQVYHTLDRYRQRTKFLDVYKTDLDFFPYRNILVDSAHDVATFKTVRNEAGIKGNLLKLFYNGYVAVRHYAMTYNHWLQDSLIVEPHSNEQYLGGRMELNIDSVGLVNGWVEINQDGNYLIDGKIRSKWFQASLRQTKYKPSFLQQSFIGTHHKWNHTFADTESSQIAGNIFYKNRTLNLSPGLTFTRLSNYVYFRHLDETDTMRSAPVQSSGSQVFFSPEFNASFTFFRHFTVSNQTVYTSFIENADDAIRIPQILTTTQLSYANIHFNGNLDMHAGVDIHWKSAYFAPGYDPAIRQFYNQDVFESVAFPIVDIFFNAKIKRGRIFLKYNNLLQTFSPTGYFATPYYPGQRNVVDFGFDWSFYD
jgi:hypothetical protein